MTKFRNFTDPSKPLKIYVAGPYTPTNGDSHDAARIAYANTKRAIQAGIALIEKGQIPFIPHLTHFIHLETDKPLPKEFYYEYDMAWLKCCDALLYLGSSEGADKERKWAEQNGLMIFESLNDVPIFKKTDSEEQEVLSFPSDHNFSPGVKQNPLVSP